MRQFGNYADLFEGATEGWRRAGVAVPFSGEETERAALRAASLARVEADMARAEAEEDVMFPELLEDAA